MKEFKNPHPGELLQEFFLTPLKISAIGFAKEVRLPRIQILELTKGKRRITEDTVIRLSKYFGNSKGFWLGLQANYDSEKRKNP